MDAHAGRNADTDSLICYPQTGLQKIIEYYQSVGDFLHFCETSLLTGWRSESIHPLTDEGGGAASDEVLRS
jgi:hypothetical protein